jgi:hypothetical protein
LDPGSYKLLKIIILSISENIGLKNENYCKTTGYCRQGCQIFLGTKYQNGKIYQITKKLPNN